LRESMVAQPVEAARSNELGAIGVPVRSIHSPSWQPRHQANPLSGDRGGHVWQANRADAQQVCDVLEPLHGRPPGNTASPMTLGARAGTSNRHASACSSRRHGRGVYRAARGARRGVRSGAVGRGQLGLGRLRRHVQRLRLNDGAAGGRAHGPRHRGQWGCLVGASSPVVRGQAAVLVRASGGQCVCPLVSRVPATLRTLRADCAPPEVDSHRS
jgi:hypothetical protein